MKQAAHTPAPSAAAPARTAQVKLGPVPPARTAAQRGRCACGSGCPRCRGKTNSDPNPVRRKARVSTPQDSAERESDSVAERIVNGPARTTDTARRTPRARLRTTPPPLTGEPPQTAATPLRSTGEPLSPALRDDLSARFNVDLSAVRVHRDGVAAQAAAALRADAYPIGHHIVFGAHRYAPQEPSGRRLLAHELTHTVQQQREGETPASAPPIAHHPPAVQRDGPGGGVHRITMTCGRTIDCETDEGLLQYPLEEPCDMPVGDFEPTVEVDGTDVHSSGRAYLGPGPKF